jgi:hypothetical protein
MGGEEYYIWKAKVDPRRRTPTRYEKLHGVGEPFESVLAAHLKIAELKETPEYKEVILEVSDSGGFVEYRFHGQDVV